MIDVIDPAKPDLLDRLECDRLLNTWLREYHREEAAAMMACQTSGKRSVLILPIADRCLHALCHHVSLCGFHSFSEIEIEDANGIRLAVSDAAGLADLLLGEVGGTWAAKASIRKRLGESIVASRGHAAFRAQSRQLKAASTKAAPQLEQSLWFGHPFHPLAKSVGGFDASDTAAFAPERQARFKLAWLLAAPEAAASFAGEAGQAASARRRLVEASGLPQERLAGRVLLPCHPWQAKRLQENPELQADLKTGRLVLTAPSGDRALATSSVRTVWFQEKQLFVKLPLEARITNFSRVNTHEEIVRSIAGADALFRVRDEVENAGISILPECCGGILRGIGGADRWYRPETGFILRDADFGHWSEPLVAAGLFEPDPISGRSNLAAISPDLDETNVEPFLVAYIDVVLFPLLRLLETTGIALEAHAQNSLVSFQDGLPVRLFVRDLEGIAVDRQVYEAAGISDARPLASPLFYERDIVWRRFLYYVVVNHFAHAVSTVSKLSRRREADLWSIAVRHLSRHAHHGSAAEALLTAPLLPAKANLRSCLAERGEQPDYVSIPNPFTCTEALHLRRAIRVPDLADGILT